MLPLPGVLRARPVWVSGLVVLLWAAHSLWSVLAGNAKLDEAEIAGRQALDLEVVLGFEPEAFHITRFQDVGRLIRIEDRSAFLMDVPVAEARALARHYWVDDLRPWDGTTP